MNPLEWAVDNLRDHLNHPRTRTRLGEGSEAFLQAAAALDILGDTQLAIDAYPPLLSNQPDHAGTYYLLVYGLLQAFQLQQDAGTNLSKALGFKPTTFDYESLGIVRDARVAVAGHPSRRERRVPEPTFYFVRRAGLNGASFELMAASPTVGLTREVVNLRLLVDLQRRGMEAFLADLTSAVQREEQEHYMEFRTRPLRPLLEGRGYEFEKIKATGLFGGRPDNVMAPGSLAVLREALERFRAALVERGLAIESLSGVEFACRVLDLILPKLDSYFKLSTGRLDWLEAYALACLAEAEWDRLAGMAGEIDAEYETGLVADL